MPWIWVGRFCFDLEDVILVARHVGPDGGVSVTIRPGVVVDLGGEEGESFLRAWDQHTAAKPIERGPPRVLVPRLIVPKDPVQSEA